MKRPSWITEDGYLDLAKFPIDGVLKQALGKSDEGFFSALRVLHSMRGAGRQEAGIFLLGLLLNCTDDWKKRGEIVRALEGFHTQGCADILFAELRRVSPSNTTRRYLAAVLDVLSSMPRKLIAPGLEALSEDKSFSHKMRQKFRSILCPSWNGLSD